MENSLTYTIFLSTLSLRRATCGSARDCHTVLISIHALLAESDSTVVSYFSLLTHFYPRSPCGERRVRQNYEPDPESISIHALLAESDCCGRAMAGTPANFYPRSPCGERRGFCGAQYHSLLISIHALLAESDLYGMSVYPMQNKFLSTLSLRRATVKCHKKQFLFCS